MSVFQAVTLGIITFLVGAFSGILFIYDAAVDIGVANERQRIRSFASVNYWGQRVVTLAPDY